MKKYLVLTVLLFLWWGPFTLAQPQPVLKIVVTTDVHGAYFPIDWFDGKPVTGSLAHVQSFVLQQTKSTGTEVLLLDNGDLIQGDPASYYSNFEQIGHPNVAARILNYMNYGAATVGNHDIEAGHPVYDKLAGELNFPLLGANVIDVQTNKPYFQPYTIIKRAGLTIAVIGLVTPRIPDWLPPVLWSGIRFTGMVETARDWMARVKEEASPDLVIGLFHAGVDPGYGGQNAANPLNENASRLVAEQVEGFDIIFTGHDHRRWNIKVAGPSGDSVLLLGGASRAEEVAVATIWVQGHGGTGTRGELVRMDYYEPDPEFIAHFAGYIDSVRAFVERPVARLTGPVTTDDSWFGPSGFTDLIHRAQLGLTGADLSFAAPLSFRASLEAGPIAVKDLFRLYRFENLLYTIELTGTEILKYLNYSYSLWMSQMNSQADPMLRIRMRPDGSWGFVNATYNFDSAMGLDYTVDLRKPPGSMVTIQRFTDGRPFQPDGRYRVAMNSYRGSGGGGHLEQGAGLSKEEMALRVIWSSATEFRSLLASWLRAAGEVDPNPASTWKVLPEGWIREAAPRDRQRLFGNGGAGE
ncbi:MAG: bifunctional UDP-sugar hydrolase/5'-nucleotidase [Bacteroidales bacterium]